MTHDQNRGRPVPTPAPAPSYQGRLLPRPDEELVDQGLGFDVATLVARRNVLRALGLGVTTLGLAACGGGSSSTATASSSTATASSSTGTASSLTAASAGAASTGAASTEIPDETAGPYPGDGSNGPDVLNRSGIVRQDIRSSFGTGNGTAAGVPMRIELIVQDLANGGKPFAGAAVYVWHCNREGGYSMYTQGITDQNYLRGVQIADADGTVRFTSTFPGCYPRRWPHVHFEVYPRQADITDATKAIATSQLALPEQACKAVYAQTGYQASVTNLAGITLAGDMVFGDDAGAHQLGTTTGDVATGYTVSLVFGVDTRTTPTGGGMPGGPGGPGMPGGSGGPGGPGMPGGSGAPGGPVGPSATATS